jgi:hypothetical protein
MPNAQCPMLNAQCSMLNADCDNAREQWCAFVFIGVRYRALVHWALGIGPLGIGHSFFAPPLFPAQLRAPISVSSGLRDD